ncbi:hypothetical protein AAVH_08467 [Aphelenchoides avenae]|nr:hypothetical protein AAVH_08467 [Aphelenchus avenae]
MVGKVEITEGSQPGEPTWMNALKVSKSPEGSASEWKLVKKLRKPQPREWTPLEASIVVNSYTNAADKSAVILGYRSDELFFHYGTERKVGEEVDFYAVDVETTTPPIHLAVKPETVHSNVLSSFKNKKYVVDFTVTRLGYNRRRHLVSTLGVVQDGRRLINEEHIRRHITVVVEGTGDADNRRIEWRVLGVCCPTQREIDELGFQELKAQLNEARSRNSVLHEDLAKLGNRLTQLQTAQEEAGEMQGRMRELEAEIAAKNAEMSALHRKIAELERDEETLTREPTTEEQEEVFVRRASEFWSNYAATPEHFQRQKEESMEEFIDRLLL